MNDKLLLSLCENYSKESFNNYPNIEYIKKLAFEDMYSEAILSAIGYYAGVSRIINAFLGRPDIDDDVIDELNDFLESDNAVAIALYALRETLLISPASDGDTPEMASYIKSLSVAVRILVQLFDKNEILDESGVAALMDFAESAESIEADPSLALELGYSRNKLAKLAKENSLPSVEPNKADEPSENNEPNPEISKLGYKYKKYLSEFFDCFNAFEKTGLLPSDSKEYFALKSVLSGAYMKLNGIFAEDFDNQYITSIKKVVSLACVYKNSILDIDSFDDTIIARVNALNRIEMLFYTMKNSVSDPVDSHEGIDNRLMQKLISGILTPDLNGSRAAEFRAAFIDANKIYLATREMEISKPFVQAYSMAVSMDDRAKLCGMDDYKVVEILGRGLKKTRIELCGLMEQYKHLMK